MAEIARALRLSGSVTFMFAGAKFFGFAFCCRLNSHLLVAANAISVEIASVLLSKITLGAAFVAIIHY